MDTLNWSLNDRRFDGAVGTQKIITDALFNKGYRRFSVKWGESPGAIERERVMWAKDSEIIGRTVLNYGKAGGITIRALTVEAMPFGLYFVRIQQTTDGWGRPAKQIVGDAIILDPSEHASLPVEVVLADAIRDAFPDEGLFPVMQGKMFE